MTESGYGHTGRIPHYGGGRGHSDNRAMPEPPACIQNAMMTKDKKPFTYTPGGLDLSQIKTPSMARRLARQRSQEEHELAYAQQPNGHIRTGGGAPPPQSFQGGPPPPPQTFQGCPPPPPPPPPLVIQTPASGTARPETVIKPVGERPEIVIPENPIGMLRKTNSPYHWEQEQVERERLGAIPKFVEKIPSPVMQQNPPMEFSQQPPATYTPNMANNAPRQNTYGGVAHQPESPLHKPEPQYPAKPSIQSPGVNNTPTRDFLQRQDSQFNKSPTPFGPHSSPQNNGSPISPAPNNQWRQPEKRESPLVNSSPQQRSPFSPTLSNRSPQFTPTSNSQSSPSYQNDNSSPVFHTLPRTGPKIHENYANNIRQSPPKNVFNNTIFNNVRNDARSESPKVDPSNPTPWRTNTLNRPQPRNESNYSQVSNSPNVNNAPYYKTNDSAQNAQPPWIPQQNEQNEWKRNQQTETNPWKQQHQNDTASLQHPQNDTNYWKNQQGQQNSSPILQSSEPRYQTHMSIPVTARKTQPFEQDRPIQQQQLPQPQPNKEVVYITQEPVYYHPNSDSPKAIPPWVKTQKEKTPPPEWCQRPLDGRKSLSRELVSPPKGMVPQPEWVQKSNELRSAPRDLSSPPLIHQNVQPTWSTKPSENRKSLPRDTQPSFHNGAQNGYGNQGSHTIPVQYQSDQSSDTQPQLRIIIDMQNPQNQAQLPYSQPTQRIMRVLSPQLTRLDQQEAPRQQDMANLNNQPRTRIIPIQIEGGGNEAPNRSFGGRY